MHVDDKKVAELKQYLLHLEKRRWELQRKGNLSEFAEKSAKVSGIFNTTEALGIDLGIRRAGPFYKEKIDEE